MQDVYTGILIAISIIVIVEIRMVFRKIINLPREIDELKKKVSSIEEQLNNRNE